MALCTLEKQTPHPDTETLFVAPVRDINTLGWNAIRLIFGQVELQFTNPAQEYAIELMFALDDVLYSDTPHCEKIILVNELVAQIKPLVLAIDRFKAQNYRTASSSQAVYSNLKSTILHYRNARNPDLRLEFEPWPELDHPAVITTLAA